MRFAISSRSLIVFALALTAGLVAAWSARQYLQSRIQQIEDRARTPMARRIVAAYDLPAGTRLNSDNVAVREFPAAVVSSASLEPGRFTEVSDTALRAPLRAGDVILPIHMASGNSEAFSSRVGQGRRAMTIPVDVINSVSGLLEPGDLIDLYVSFDYRRKRVTAPLLQGVLVLATGARSHAVAERAGAGGGTYAAVTLDLSPEDAIKLVAARQGGTLTALLRHPADAGANQKAVRGDLATLLGVAAPARATPKRVPVIYGDRAIKSLPGTNPSAFPLADQAPLFDLPGMPELVSAWLMAREAEPGEGPPVLQPPRETDR